MEDCIIFEIGKEPYVDQVNPESGTVSFGTDEKGDPVWRRFGVFTITSPGIDEKYLYVSEHLAPPPKALIKAAIDALKPRPYNK
ncbi:hypothetical protein [Pantoea sp.]|uniref:hypothetical protein n=1 Tax=Pantoea sp. TaxID=69393 RepID=UPI0028B027B9|nr:hypothetical protein [Pantoea sp.]